MVHGSPLANTFPLVERKFAVGSLGKSIAKVDFWTTHDAPWSHGPQITDAGSSPPRVRVGPHASALAAGVGLWVPTNGWEAEWEERMESGGARWAAYEQEVREYDSLGLGGQGPSRLELTTTTNYY